MYYNARTLEKRVLNTCELARIRKSCRSWEQQEIVHEPERRVYASVRVDARSAGWEE
jgi:hypothetical protein